MIGVLYTKTFQTALLSTLLFYVLANPDTFKMVKRIPGLKFVMKSTNEITHSGVITHALLFGVVLFLCVLLINKTLVKHFPFLNVVEHMNEAERVRINTTCAEVLTAANYAAYKADFAVDKCREITDNNPAQGEATTLDPTWKNVTGENNWRGDTSLVSRGDFFGQSQNAAPADDPNARDWTSEPTAPPLPKCRDSVPDNLKDAFCKGFGKKFTSTSAQCDDYECRLTDANRAVCCTE